MAKRIIKVPVVAVKETKECTITYKCGHQRVLTFSPKSQDSTINKRLEFENERLCTECYIAEMKNASNEARVLVGDSNIELPIITGTERQKVWAFDIMLGFVAESIKLKGNRPDISRYVDLVMVQMLAQENAQFWINNRKLTLEQAAYFIQELERRNVNSETSDNKTNDSIKMDMESIILSNAYKCLINGLIVSPEILKKCGLFSLRFK